MRENYNECNVKGLKNNKKIRQYSFNKGKPEVSPCPWQKFIPLFINNAWQQPQKQSEGSLAWVADQPAPGCAGIRTPGLGLPGSSSDTWHSSTAPEGLCTFASILPLAPFNLIAKEAGWLTFNPDS